MRWICGYRNFCPHKMKRVVVIKDAEFVMCRLRKAEMCSYSLPLPFVLSLDPVIFEQLKNRISIQPERT